MCKDLKNGLSVVLIACNEELNIERCLKSVESIADEIIVVYNDCTDKTAEIAKSFGAHCYEEKWHGHRNQKNIAMAKASFSYVLSMDADESLSKNLRNSILSVINSKDLTDIKGYKFNRRSFFLGRWILHGEWYPDTKVRFVKNGYAIWKGTSEHDKLFVNGKISKLNGDLLHFSYPSMGSILEKISYFSDYHLKRQIGQGQSWRLHRVLLRPPWRFFRAYFLKLGFLDGFPGLFIAVSSSFSCFFKHSRLYEKLNSTEGHEDNQIPQN